MRTIHFSLWAFVAALFVVVSACSDAGLVEPGQDEVVSSVTAAKNHPVRFKGYAWGGGVIVGGPGECTVAGVPGLPVQMSGEGMSTHLGRYTFVQEDHCINLVDFTYEGTAVLTVANGDELRAAYSGQTQPDGSFAHDGEFVGGTGRFEGATGSYVQYGMGTDPSTGSFTYEIWTEGTILY